jgi:hypothetical protein
MLHHQDFIDVRRCAVMSERWAAESQSNNQQGNRHKPCAFHLAPRQSVFAHWQFEAENMPAIQQCQLGRRRNLPATRLGAAVLSKQTS